jgi:hypothetical protein
VVQRFATKLGRFDKDLYVFNDLRLAGKSLLYQRAVCPFSNSFSAADSGSFTAAKFGFAMFQMYVLFLLTKLINLAFEKLLYIQLKVLYLCPVA